VISHTGESRPDDAELLGRMLPDGTYIPVSLSRVLLADDRKASIVPLRALRSPGKRKCYQRIRAMSRMCQRRR